MKILFDSGTPKPVARSPPGRDVTFARQIGWLEFKNGELLRRAEEAGYELLVTSDKNIRNQQDLSGRRLSLCELFGVELCTLFSVEAVSSDTPRNAVPIFAAQWRSLGSIERQPRRSGYDCGGGCVMASLDWSQCAAVESVPGKVSGAWVLKGTRMPVSAIFENLEAGASVDDIMEWFDGLNREQVKAVIEFAARSLDTPPALAHRQ